MLQKILTLVTQMVRSLRSFLNYQHRQTFHPTVLKHYEEELASLVLGKRCPWTFGISGCQLLFHPQFPHLAIIYSLIFTRSPYITITLQNIPKQAEKTTKFFIFNLSWVELLVSCWYAESQKHQYYQMFWTIIYHHSKQLTSVAPDVLERTLAPLRENH